MRRQAEILGAPAGTEPPPVTTVVEIRRPVVPPPVSRARPPATSWLVVERSELLRRLTRSVERVPLTLIHAPAGTGKTVLAADWASRRTRAEQPVAWLTVTERDDEPAVFWAHLQDALALAGALPAELERRPAYRDAADVDALSSRMLRLSAPVVVVVDAADRLRSGTVYDQVGSLLDAGGDRFRVVMTSRVEPPLPIARYRVEDRVAEILADDLALTEEEVGRVLARHHLRPSPALAREVHRRTEGWAAGVRLAALRLGTEGPHADLDGVAAPYVRAEIVAGLTPLERDVLTATSVVDDLPPGLARALTGRADADATLRSLAAGNAFVLPAHARPGALRLHPLVRELLLDDLDQLSPGRSAALHRRAAAWFDQHDDLGSAVRHVAAAGDWEAAAERVAEGRGLAEVIAGTATGTVLAETLAAIPVTGSPDVTVLRAAIALRDGDLDLARGALDQAAAEPGVAASLVRTAWYDAAGRQAETLAAARETRSRLAAADAPDTFVAAVVSAAEGAAQLRVGDLDAASTALNEAVAATTGAAGPLRLRCLAELALAEACAGHLTRALELADAAEQVAAEEGVPVTSRPVALELARVWVAVERQELVLAQRSLNRIGRAPAGRPDAMWRTATVLLRARYLRDRGDVGGARRQLRQAGAASGWLRDHLDAEARDLGIGEPRPGTPGERGGDRRVHELLDGAARCCDDGDLAAARAEVGRALQLARTERLRRPFTHAPPTVRSLLRDDARVHALAGWLGPDRLPGGGAEASPSVAPPVLDALSERELQVLRHLAAFLTTPEIAAEMFISVNTVRTHVRRVLEKLSVSRRHEAVRRGRELGLV